MFGFRVGEERRWEIESGNLGLGPQEGALWTMRLEIINEGSLGAVAHFRLTHELRLEPRRDDLSSSEVMDTTHTVVDLWVNEGGFPLWVEYREDRSGTITRHGEINTRWRVNELFVWNEGVLQPTGYTLPIPGTETVDLSVPEGVFLSSQVNPGLIALPFLRALAESDRGRDFVAFDPTPLVGPASMAAAADASLTPDSRLRSARRQPTHAQLAARTLRQSVLAIGPVERIAIGDVATDVHRVGLSAGDEAWVTPSGKVARMSLTMRGVTVWIRLLPSSESG